MKTIKVWELTGQALDWAVAKCEGHKAAQIKANGPVHLFMTVGYNPSPYSPSTNWAQCGPILEREMACKNGRLVVKDETFATATTATFSAEYTGHNWEQNRKYRGPTPLVAAMRCYVASKVGDTVEIPEELLE